MGEPKTKGIVKCCPSCGKPMTLIKYSVIPSWYWICWVCPNLIDYQSFEASQLKEIEVE